MVTLINKNKQNFVRFETHRPRCRNCDRDLWEYIQQEGAKVWGQKGRTGFARIVRGQKARLYCDDCKKDLFEGVKLRKEFER